MKGNTVRKGIVLGIISLFFGAGVISSFGGAIGNLNQSNSKIPTVDLNRGILYVGGEGPGNYTTIQEAIDDASNGDTVFVYDYSSPYYENLVIFKSITLIGEDKKTTVIDGNFEDNTIYVNAPYVTITGFSIVHSNYDYSGILLSASEGCTITLNDIKNNNYGIKAQDYCFNNNIYHNNFIENSVHAYDDGENTWDDGKRYGNYWDDYEEKYPEAEKLPIKRIWDTPYEIFGEEKMVNFDQYPLIYMGSWVKSNPYSCPQNKPINYDYSLLNWFFKRLPNLFLILQNILEL